MGLIGGKLPLFNSIPLGFAATMAILDTLMLSLLKYMRVEKQSLYWIFLPMLIYAFQPVVFYMSLHYESLTVMNLLLDLISDVLVTFVGLFIFQETIGPYKKAGVVLSFISIFLMSLNDGM
jgi:drug/metabolite transporter (DMT)-like permease